MQRMLLYLRDVKEWLLRSGHVTSPGCAMRGTEQKTAETIRTEQSVNRAHKWNAIVQKKIKTLRRQSYKQKITSLRKPTELWNMVNVLKKLKVGEPNPPLCLNGEELIYPEDKANHLSLFYQHREMLACFDHRPLDIQTTTTASKDVRRICQSQTRVCKRLRRLPDTIPADDLLNADITEGEVLAAQKQLPDKKAAGPDGIKPELLSRLTNGGIKGITSLFNLSWSLGSLPHLWKTSIEHPLIKPGKPANRGDSYRPISLTANLCKWMERVLIARLFLWLVTENKLSDHQAGSRPQRDTSSTG